MLGNLFQGQAHTLKLSADASFDPVDMRSRLLNSKAPDGKKIHSKNGDKKPKKKDRRRTADQDENLRFNPLENFMGRAEMHKDTDLTSEKGLNNTNLLNLEKPSTTR